MHTFLLTNPERLVYPRDGITRRDVAEYFLTVAPRMLRAMAGRPLQFEHWPDGIDRPSWFQQNVGGEAEQALSFARQLGRAVARAVPGVTLERDPRRGGDRLFLDVAQNGWGKTLIAPYSLRARDGAPVATPLG